MNNQINRLSRRFFLGAGTAAIIVACSQTKPEQPQSKTKKETPKQAGQVNIYSARHYNTDDQLYDGFTKKTGVKVNLIEGKDDELIERIKSEGANSPADILMTVDGGRLWRAKQADVFASVNSKVLNEKIPANLRDPNNLWFAFSKRARVIMYNKDKVKPTDLATYEDLTNPQWKGKILMRSSSNVYNQSLVAGMIEEKGEKATSEWIEGLVANFARPPQSTDTGNIEDVAAGLGDITLANTYYLARYEDKPEIFEKIGVIFPNQKNRGTHVNVSGAGLLKNAPNKENAIAFLEYLASPEAQEFFAVQNNEYPVVQGTPLKGVVKSFGEFKDDTTNVAAYGKNNSTAVKIMDRSGWK